MILLQTRTRKKCYSPKRTSWMKVQFSIKSDKSLSFLRHQFLLQAKRFHLGQRLLLCLLCSAGVVKSIKCPTWRATKIFHWAKLSLTNSEINIQKQDQWTRVAKVPKIEYQVAHQVKIWSSVAPSYWEPQTGRSKSNRSFPFWNSKLMKSIQDWNRIARAIYKGSLSVGAWWKSQRARHRRQNHRNLAPCDIRCSRWRTWIFKDNSSIIPRMWNLWPRWK